MYILFNYLTAVLSKTTYLTENLPEEANQIKYDFSTFRDCKIVYKLLIKTWKRKKC